MAENELEAGKEIEEKIVEELARRHMQFVAENQDSTQGQGGSSPPEEAVGENALSAALQFQNQVPDNQDQNQEIGGPGGNQVLGNGVIGNQLVGQAKSLYFQMKFNSDGTTVTQAIPNPSPNLRRSFSSKEDHGLTDEMQEFIRAFKSKRMSLGYTQEDIGRELSEMNGPTYSQSFISRFEGKQLGMKAAERMRPILEAFLQQKEDEGSKNMKFGKKRRRRTCFTHEAQKLLNDHFLKNPKPTPDEIQMIANELGFDLSTVKVWFCNRKQNLKRQGQPIPDNSLKSELEARRKQPDGNETVEAHFQNALTVPASQVKHILSASPPTGNVTNLPFILSQDGNVTIVTSPNSLQGAHILPQFIASSSSQQLVLSQVPFVQTVSAMNQGMSGVVTVPTVQPVQVLAARQLPAQVLYQSAQVNTVSVTDEGQRVVAHTVTSSRKSEAEAALLAGQFSHAVTRTNELSGVSPAMITRTITNEIGGSITDQTMEEQLHSQAGGQIRRQPVEVIAIDDNMDDPRDMTRLKSPDVAKKLRTMTS
uniref:POU6 protein n=1 Tax=Aurelia sp. DG-2014 TaxID=1507770 RepID=A0A068AZV7_9CNID|nr:POU-like homeodomain-containing protein [Aurelia sp. DG-2014]